MKKLSALYYPFSRCISPDSMKQMLLIFDDLAFLDPVEDDAWRAKLLKDFEKYDSQFSNYSKIDPELPVLYDQGYIRRVDPRSIPSHQQQLAAASAASDLQDNSFLQLASNPQKFQMPSVQIAGKDSWQIFRPKLPNDFIDALMESEALREHLIRGGNDRLAWSLSYAAGSAISIGMHLQAADQLGVAPVTDSELHHCLLLQKVARSSLTSDKITPIPDDAIRHLTSNIASTMLADVMPEAALRRITFKEIIAFRDRTESLRREFISEVEERLGRIRTVSNESEWIVAGRQVVWELKEELHKYQTNFQSNRDKVWPGIVSSMNNALVSGGLGAVALSYIGGPHQALVGSIVGASLGLLKTTLDLQVDKKKLTNDAGASVAYLSRVVREV